MTNLAASRAAHAAKRKGKCNGKRRNKLKTVKRALSVWECYQADMSQGRIAEAHGISQSAVSQILSRTYRDMHTSIVEIAGMSLVKELERTREYCEERQDRLLGLGITTKHELSGQVQHTTNLLFDSYSAEELAVLEFLIAKGSGSEWDQSKRCILIDADPLLALEYKPNVETFNADDDIA
jgi:predicted transcriptional regulator